MPTSRKSTFKTFLDAFPILQFVGAGVIGIAATYTTIQLTQSSQAAEIRRNSERIEHLQKESEKQVSRELFDERTKSIQEDLKNIKDLIKEKKR